MKRIAYIYTAKHSDTNYGEYSTTYAFSVATVGEASLTSQCHSTHR